MENKMDNLPAEVDELHENLQISLQSAVEQICSAIAEKNYVMFTPEFKICLTAFMFKHIGDISQKLEYFAKHAKRSEITNDDLKLFFRCSPQMLAVIENSTKYSDIDYSSLDVKYQNLSIEYALGSSANHNSISLTMDCDDNSTDSYSIKEQRHKKKDVKKGKERFKKDKKEDYVIEDEGTDAKDQEVERKVLKKNATKGNKKKKNR